MGWLHSRVSLHPTHLHAASIPGMRACSRALPLSLQNRSPLAACEAAAQLQLHCCSPGAVCCAPVPALCAGVLLLGSGQVDFLLLGSGVSTRLSFN